MPELAWLLVRLTPELGHPPLCSAAPSTMRELDSANTWMEAIYLREETT